MLDIKKPEEIISYLHRTINTHLANGKSVLWIVAGGSAIPIVSEVSRLLKGEKLHNLSVTLTDERYGPVDHPDSNWLQMKKEGFLLAGAQLLPVLNGESIEKNTAEFNKLLTKRLRTEGIYTLGLFGMGSDGHTAGILPDSPVVKSTALASWYDGGQFMRITMTPRAISMLDEAILYAVGRDKWGMIERLKSRGGINIQPAHILKAVPKFTIFSDYERI